MYARTTSKAAITPGIFWAEEFDLNNLPNVSFVTVSLYKEAECSGKEGRRFGTGKIGSKKYRKTQNQLIGFITIPTSEIAVRNDVQAWFTLQQPTDAVNARNPFLTSPLSLTASSVSALTDLDTVGNNGLGGNMTNSIIAQSAKSASNLSHLGGCGGGGIATSNGGLTATSPSAPELRLRARYLSLEVLALTDYARLKSLVLEKSLTLTNWLEPLLTVRGKEELASCLVSLHECNGSLVSFLTSLVIADMARLKSDSMAFRSNTMATKAVECFVKLAGSTYLHNLLYRQVHNVLTCLTAWEVNPEKLPPGARVESTTTTGSSLLVSNQKTLLHHLRLVWSAIQNSRAWFPTQLVQVFSSFRAALESSRGTEFCDNLISSCIFLRLICPALLSPSLFGLVNSYPGEPACQRNLTLLAKSLQSLANFMAFGDKEPYMRFLNSYVTAQLPLMRSFIRSISTLPANLTSTIDNTSAEQGNECLSDASQPPFRDRDSSPPLCDLLDEGYELASLHSILVEVCCGSSTSTSFLVSPPTRCGPDRDQNGAEPSHLDSLPDELADLPACLEELSQLLRQPPTAKISSTFTTTRSTVSSTANSTPLVSKPGAHQDPTKMISRSMTPELLGIQVGSTLPSNAWRFANPKQSPESGTTCYTLHQNPGVRGPGNAGLALQENSHDSTLVSIIPNGQSGTNGSLEGLTHRPTTLLEVTASGSVCPVMARSDLNDYDEPYTGQQSDTEAEETVPTVIQCVSLRGPSEDEDLHESPIYDFVPFSESSSSSSSIDEIVAANQESPPPSPCQERPIASADEKAVDDERMTAQESGTAPRPPPAELVPPQATASSGSKVLSPRLAPRQVASASLKLTTKSSMTLPSVKSTGEVASSQLTSPSVTSAQVSVGIPLPPVSIQLLPSSRSPAYSHQQRIQSTSPRETTRAPFTQSAATDRTWPGSLDPFISPVTPEQVSPSRLPSGNWTGTSTLPDPSGQPRDAQLPAHTTDSCNYNHHHHHSNNNNNNNNNEHNMKQEVTRLRNQLQQSQAAAVWATNRLSQKEAELLRLRCQILEQQRMLQLQQQQQQQQTANKLSAGSTPTSSGTNTLKTTATHFLVAFSSSDSPVTYANASNNISSTGSLKLDAKASHGRPTATATATATEGKPVATTFDDLDDAMARLEREQAELLREQVKIRARMEASRRRTGPLQTTVVASPSSPNRPQVLPTRLHASPGHQPVRIASGYPNVDLTGQSGFRVRHQPPPQPPPLGRPSHRITGYARRC